MWQQKVEVGKIPKGGGRGLALFVNVIPSPISVIRSVISAAIKGLFDPGLF